MRTAPADAIKQRLAKEFKDVFTKRLEKKGHVVVDAAAPDVLLLRPALVNVEITAPQTHAAGRTRTFIRSAGSMTLVLELYDSSTNTLLARIIDPQTDVQPYPTEANRATNKWAADRILRRWADLLASHLGEVAKGSPSTGDGATGEPANVEPSNGEVPKDGAAKGEGD